jgi:hypothetical protein
VVRGEGETRKGVAPVLHLPAVMLLWVNSHGGFIFGVVFLCLVLAGETANTLLGSRARLDARARTHLLIAVAASLACSSSRPTGGATRPSSWTSS